MANNFAQKFIDNLPAALTGAVVAAVGSFAFMYYTHGKSISAIEEWKKNVNLETLIDDVEGRVYERLEPKIPTSIGETRLVSFHVTQKGDVRRVSRERSVILEDFDPQNWSLVGAWAMMQQSGFFKHHGGVEWHGGAFSYNVRTETLNGKYRIAVTNWRHSSAGDDGGFIPRATIYALLQKKLK